MKRRTLLPFRYAIVLCTLATSCTEPTRTGVVYHDGNRSSRSEYLQAIGDADVPLPGVDVFLLGREFELSTQTGPGGSFLFEGLEPGTYLLDVGIGPAYDSTSNNRPLRLPQAVREGHLNIVTIGDSLATYGSDVLFPERLANRFSEIVPTSFSNVARNGSRTWDWLPGSQEGYFEDRLLPVLPDADILTICLGINNLTEYIPVGPPWNPIEALLNFLQHPEYLLNIVPDLYTIIGEIRKVNPTCDIVYVAYWNLVNSILIQEVLGILQPLAVPFGSIAIDMLRNDMAAVEGIVLADVDGELGLTLLDPYLSNWAHPNDAGHQLHADVIFRCLGGVVTEAGTHANRLFGFYAPDLVP